MNTNGASKFSYLLVGLGLGAIGGLMAAILASKENREALRERGGNSLDYVNHQAEKVRQAADAIVQQGKRLFACSDSVTRSTEAEKQVYHEDKREHLGG